MHLQQKSTTIHWTWTPAIDRHRGWNLSTHRCTCSVWSGRGLRSRELHCNEYYVHVARWESARRAFLSQERQQSAANEYVTSETPSDFGPPGMPPPIPIPEQFGDADSAPSFSPTGEGENTDDHGWIPCTDADGNVYVATCLKMGLHICKAPPMCCDSYESAFRCCSDTTTTTSRRKQRGSHHLKHAFTRSVRVTALARLLT